MERKYTKLGCELKNPKANFQINWNYHVTRLILNEAQERIQLIRQKSLTWKPMSLLPNGFEFVIVVPKIFFEYLVNEKRPFQIIELCNHGRILFDLRDMQTYNLKFLSNLYSECHLQKIIIHEMHYTKNDIIWSILYDYKWHKQ